MIYNCYEPKWKFNEYFVCSHWTFMPIWRYWTCRITASMHWANAISSLRSCWRHLIWATILCTTWRNRPSVGWHNSKYSIWGIIIWQGLMTMSSVIWRSSPTWICLSIASSTSVVSVSLRCTGCGHWISTLIDSKW